MTDYFYGGESIIDTSSWLTSKRRGHLKAISNFLYSIESGVFYVCLTDLCESDIINVLVFCSMTLGALVCVRV